jgi:hypothetical protein
VYSQQIEEQYILEAFKAHPSETKRLLDIGGWHPTIFSNTRALVELGWGGVIIEPSPGPFINFLRGCVKCGDVPSELYGERHQAGIAKPCAKCGSAETYGLSERFSLVLAGVGLEPGLVAFNASDDAISTSVEREYETWKKIGGYYGRFLCPVITLDQIANQFGGFDFINFDAEGVSADLFLRAMELGWRPRCCVVEHDRRTTELLSKAREYTTVYANETNLVMVKK